MWKRALAIALMGAGGIATASAQEAAVDQMDSCRRFTAAAETSASRDILYAHATCVAARAGVVSPANGPLSQEELISILMLMSLPKTPAGTHASS